MTESVLVIGTRPCRVVSLNTVIVGTGAAGFNAALRLRDYGQDDIAIVTEGVEMGTSRNTGSDKQTYYKMNLCGDFADSPRAMAEDLFRGKAVDGDIAYAEAALSVPCVLGYNLWNRMHPFGGDSTILDLEDFIVSNNLLPLGALLCVIFCTWGFGWGMAGFRKEMEAGQARPLPTAFYWYCRWVLPLIILVVFAVGYWTFFR